MNFSKVGFNLGYLEEQNHIGNEHYVNAGISLNFNNNNKLSFETKKNFKTDSTEYYDINYQYMNDCLTAVLVFRREYYEDSDNAQNIGGVSQQSGFRYDPATGQTINTETGEVIESKLGVDEEKD